MPRQSQKTLKPIKKRPIEPDSADESDVAARPNKRTRVNRLDSEAEDESTQIGEANLRNGVKFIPVV